MYLRYFAYMQHNHQAFRLATMEVKRLIFHAFPNKKKLLKLFKNVCLVLNSMKITRFCGHLTEFLSFSRKKRERLIILKKLLKKIISIRQKIISFYI